jgi:hypothetical protein
MKPFTFHNPTKIVFGEGTVPKVGEEARAVGRKALFVYGRESLKTSGLYDRVAASLRAAGVAWVEHPGVKANPVVSHARAGAALAKAERVDFVLAVGGGSVIDEAKGIAAGAAGDTDLWAFYQGTATIGAALPLVTVLTLPATGTEMNGGTVLTDETTQEKIGFGDPHLFPRCSILDPVVTVTVPRSQTAYGTVDAMSHLLEGYFTHDGGWVPLQERYAEGVIRGLMEATERILVNPGDLEARATHMWGATLAWNTLAPCGLGGFTIPNHMLEHPLSAVHDIAHGAGLAVVLPAWMAYTAGRGHARAARIARFARAVLGATAADDVAAAAEGAARLKAWFAKIGAPTSMAAAGIASPDLERLADLAVRLTQRWEIADHAREDILAVYRACR